MEYLNPLGGPGTEYRMIRSDRYKYVAFHDCEDLAFDLQADPDEQLTIAQTTDPEISVALDRLRTSVYDGFDFDQAIDCRQSETEHFQDLYPGRVSPRTSNQILLGDGRLVEADLTLEHPDVVSDQPAMDFDDWPEH